MAENKYEEFDHPKPPILPSENMQLFPDPLQSQNQPPPSNEYPQYQPEPGYILGQPYPFPQQPSSMTPIVQQQLPPPLSYGIPIDVRQES